MNSRAVRSGNIAYWSRTAFTLVELLVVIGIIALLISILLPSLSRAKEAARLVKCMSNVKQLSNATMMWTNEHSGLMPTQGGRNIYRWKSPQSRTFVQVTNADGDDNSESRRDVTDWIAWQRQIDPLYGTPSTASAQNITCSAIAPYLGRKKRTHNLADPSSANRIDPGLEVMFRCPSDPLDSRPSAADASTGAYRYSYTINANYANPIRTGGLRIDGKFNGKYTSIKNPSQKSLFWCEDERTVYYGCFIASPDEFINNSPVLIDLVSSRHDRKKARTKHRGGFVGGVSPTAILLMSEDSRGVVGFVDGHVEFMSRKEALRSKHTGNLKPETF